MFKGWILALIKSAMLSLDSSSVTASTFITGDLSCWDSVLEFSKILEPFCIAAIAVCMMYELMQVTMKMETVRVEDIIRVIFKVTLALTCFKYAPIILRAFYTQTQLWIVALTEKFSSGTGTIGFDAWDKLSGALNGLNLLDSLGLIISGGVVCLAIRAAGLFTIAVAAGRTIELYVLLIISPIPVSFFALSDGGSGFSHITLRYFRRFFAICLQGFIMQFTFPLVSLVFGSWLNDAIATIDITGNIAEGATELIWKLLFCAIVLFGALKKSGDWAKSCLDV